MYNEIKKDIEKLSKINPEKAQKYEMELIQIECKKRFPIGCKFKSTNGEWILKQDKSVYQIYGNRVYASNGFGCLYLDGKYAELISLPEVKEQSIPEYVEWIEDNHRDGLKKGDIFKVVSIKNSNGKPYWYEIDSLKLLNGQYKTLDYFITSFKSSSKEAYNNQLRQQYPLTPEQCFTSKIEVGDEVECINGIDSPGLGFKLGLRFIVKSIENYEPQKCYFGGDGGHGVYESYLKLIKKANTTTAHTKVEKSSPKVTNRLKLKVRENPTVVITEERIKLKLNHLKTIKIKQHVNN